MACLKKLESLRALFWFIYYLENLIPCEAQGRAGQTSCSLHV